MVEDQLVVYVIPLVILCRAGCQAWLDLTFNANLFLNVDMGLLVHMKDYGTKLIVHFHNSFPSHSNVF
jgi:hypothetical protein